MSRESLGVLGGSFDPPHVAHVMLALLGLSVGGLSHVLVVPSFIHAFGKALRPFEHRLRMCELAFQHLQHVEVSAIEAELGGVSRTLRLLTELSRRYPERDLRLLVGSDILHERARWQDFDKIRELAPPMTAERVGYEAGPAELGALLPSVSSTALRAALARGQQSHLLPLAVRDYIAAERLYQDGP